MVEINNAPFLVRIASLLSGSIAVLGFGLSSLYALYLLLLGSAVGFLIGLLFTAGFVLLLVASVKVRKMKKWTLYFFSAVAICFVSYLFLSHNYNYINLTIGVLIVFLTLYLWLIRHKFV
jgi:hypothetical protein